MKRLLLLIAVLAFPATAFAQSPPPSPLQGFALHPPCEGAPQSAYAPPGGPPTIATWSERELNRGAWQMAPCMQWTAGRLRMATALSAVVRAPSLDELLSRYGALSSYKSIRVWSTMHQVWEPFSTQAAFTDGPSANYTYPDLKAADFIVGKDFYYYEVDPHTGRSIHHLRVAQRTADKVEIVTENVTSITYGMFTLFAPRALKTATYIERRSAQEWGYYQAVGVGEGSDFIAVHSASPYINRLTALYRHIAGMPTDGAPPAAPQ